MAVDILIKKYYIFKCHLLISVQSMHMHSMCITYTTKCDNSCFECRQLCILAYYQASISI